ncbi:hypothetical protein [Nocardia sp. CS682]|uniref:hypothetical protein n=1 Tax=Nocardia sp. CS682 TaxID=1047172 RepID=UPI0010755299|nr:hypothetical protein [Nocardia sp. CS682]
MAIEEDSQVRIGDEHGVDVFRVVKVGVDGTCRGRPSRGQVSVSRPRQAGTVDGSPHFRLIAMR